jgi:hypothetical protein
MEGENSGSVFLAVPVHQGDPHPPENEEFSG